MVCRFFISVILSFVFASLTLVIEKPFWPFTNVLRRIPRCVTRKMQELKNHGFRRCRGYGETNETEGRRRQLRLSAIRSDRNSFFLRLPLSVSVLSGGSHDHSFLSACTTKRFPSSRCASAIPVVRPSESIADRQPQLQPALLSLFAMTSQYRFTHSIVP